MIREAEEDEERLKPDAYGKDENCEPCTRE
jgi:hypothetical protein